MSGKQNKRLRRAALGLATAVAGEGREIKLRELLIKDHKRAGDDLHPTEELGSVFQNVHHEVVFAQQSLNSPTSLRGIVRTLKKGVRAGKIG